jgi:hypothetical protein
MRRPRLTFLSDGKPRRRLLMGSKALKAVSIEFGAHCRTSLLNDRASLVRTNSELAGHAYSVFKVLRIADKEKGPGNRQALSSVSLSALGHDPQSKQRRGLAAEGRELKCGLGAASVAPWA